MSDDVLSVVPSNPHWQPDPATGHHVAALVKSLSLVDGDGGWCEVDWHDDVALVDCGGKPRADRLPELRSPARRRVVA